MRPKLRSSRHPVDRRCQLRREKHPKSGDHQAQRDKKPAAGGSGDRSGTQRCAGAPSVNAKKPRLATHGPSQRTNVSASRRRLEGIPNHPRKTGSRKQSAGQGPPAPATCPLAALCPVGKEACTAHWSRRLRGSRSVPRTEVRDRRHQHHDRYRTGNTPGDTTRRDGIWPASRKPVM